MFIVNYLTIDPKAAKNLTITNVDGKETESLLVAWDIVGEFDTFNVSFKGNIIKYVILLCIKCVLSSIN